MKILTGGTGDKHYLPIMKELGISRLFTRILYTPYLDEDWGLDSDAYSAWKNEYLWNEYRYLEILDKAQKLGKPYFATIPDKPAQKNSMEYSFEWLEKLPQDWNWYFCLQDGMSLEDVEKYVCNDDRIKGLFLGGTHKFKGKALDYIRLAHKHGKKFHYARTSSIKRILDAYDLECDSCDSTIFLWTRTRMNTLFDLIRNNFKTTQLRMINSYVVSQDVIDRKLLPQKSF